MKWADVIIFGPGMGTGDYALKCLENVIYESNLPLLIDADGLNLLAQNPKLQEELAKQGKGERKVILTPHVGELSRLMQLSISELKRKLPEYGMVLAARLNAIVVAKDARTFTCKDGFPICVNVHGNSGMATAGSGDVLAGMVAAFAAMGQNNQEVSDLLLQSAMAAYVHGKAGIYAAKEYNHYSVKAGDLPDMIPKVFQKGGI